MKDALHQLLDLCMQAAAAATIDIHGFHFRSVLHRDKEPARARVGGVNNNIPVSPRSSALRPSGRRRRERHICGREQQPSPCTTAQCMYHHP
jgi:hypothetical protein